MNQDIVNTMYDKITDLRNTVEDYIMKHNTPEGEHKLKAVMIHLSLAIDIMKDQL